MAQPDFQKVRRQVDAFMGDQSAQAQYQSLSEKGQALHQKQHQGMPLDPEEIAAFDKERDVFFANAIAKGFVEAQEQMHKVQETVSQYVIKTFELGRAPLPADFESGCCGGGHHEEGECCGGKNHEGDEPHEHGGEGCQCHH